MKCNICGKVDLTFMKRHVCGPSWFVWAEDWEEEDAKVIYESTAADAAETFVECSLATGGIDGGDDEYPVLVMARNVPDAEPRLFTVHEEMTPSYRADD